MSSPSRLDSHLTTGGPAQSYLQTLLEEISSSSQTPRKRSVGGNAYPYSTFDTPTSRSSISHPQPPHRGHSVWVNGGPAAEDSRQRLRALDEARERRRSAGELSNAPANASSESPRPSPSSPARAKSEESCAVAFVDLDFDHSATFTCGDLPSPCAESPDIEFLVTKRNRSATSSPTPQSKRPRAEIPIPLHLSKSSPVSIRGGGFHIVSTSPSEEVDLLEPKYYRSAESFTLDRTRNNPIPPKPRRKPSPLTPPRPCSPLDGSPSPGTPAWMRPFQLVADKVSVFKHVHRGDEHSDHALCLRCFRLHGAFYRMLDTGCEVCKGDEVLQGHYWEDSYPDYRY
ncbi:hypothetical protein P280DRAFT_528898 [Massarina eburnea CBS 473.64]|uniref:Uncharacterized protein n=1 Tax=Massarina eburnea CBS 473.64 TaxID=1395130 RepID=A0A6A6RXJ1_9PLEO|nr:hypothetical protein P280DRAFT_528898 [Massarina eburnea CBS 473.64]